MFEALEIAIEDGYSKCVLFTNSLAACKALTNTESDHYKLACDVGAILNVNLNAKEAIRFIEKRITQEWNDEFCKASFQESSLSIKRSYHRYTLVRDKELMSH